MGTSVKDEDGDGAKGGKGASARDATSGNDDEAATFSMTTVPWPESRRAELSVDDANRNAARPVGLDFKLVVVRGELFGTRFDVDLSADGELLIGRSADAAIRFDDQFVSARHARICAEGNSAFIEDLDSGNGTFVDGVRIAGRVPLNAGSMIGIAQRCSLSVGLGAHPSSGRPHRRRDALTMLFDDLALHRTLDAHIERPQDEGLALVLWRITNLDDLNSRYGRHFGDKVLAGTAAVLDSADAWADLNEPPVENFRLEGAVLASIVLGDARRVYACVEKLSTRLRGPYLAYGMQEAAEVLASKTWVRGCDLHEYTSHRLLDRAFEHLYGRDPSTHLPVRNALVRRIRDALSEGRPAWVAPLHLRELPNLRSSAPVAGVRQSIERLWRGLEAQPSIAAASIHSNDWLMLLAFTNDRAGEEDLVHALEQAAGEDDRALLLARSAKLFPWHELRDGEDIEREMDSLIHWHTSPNTWSGRDIERAPFPLFLADHRLGAAATPQGRKEALCRGNETALSFLGVILLAGLIERDATLAKTVLREVSGVIGAAAWLNGIARPAAEALRDASGILTPLASTVLRTDERAPVRVFQEVLEYRNRAIHGEAEPGTRLLSSFRIALEDVAAAMRDTTLYAALSAQVFKDRIELNTKLLSGVFGGLQPLERSVTVGRDVVTRASHVFLHSVKPSTSTMTIFPLATWRQCEECRREELFVVAEFTKTRLRLRSVSYGCELMLNRTDDEAVGELLDRLK